VALAPSVVKIKDLDLKTKIARAPEAFEDLRVLLSNRASSSNDLLVPKSRSTAGLTLFSLNYATYSTSHVSVTKTPLNNGRCFIIVYVTYSTIIELSSSLPAEASSTTQDYRSEHLRAICAPHLTFLRDHSAHYSVVRAA
jgi:hypothetical protein